MMREVRIPNSQGVMDDTQTQELIVSLLNNGYVRAVMSENGLDESVIRANPWKMKTWLDHFAPCISCNGLTGCRQAIRGYFDNPVYDGVLQIEKKACRFEREKLKERSHLSCFLINDMPQDLFTVTFSRINLKGESAEYADLWQTCVSAAMEEKGLYLCGPMGTGKTYLAACAANYYAMHDRKVCFVHYPSFTRRITSMVKTGEYDREVERMGYCDLLVLDDIGAEQVSEWNRDSILLPVLSRRYDNHLTTWFTSNEDMNTLKEHFMMTRGGNMERMKAERLIERIENMSEMKTLLGEDRRKTRI